MGYPTSRLAYIDCFEVLDKALDDPKGVRIGFASFDRASHYRMRLHAARRVDRIDNERTYEEGHRLHGRSIYDEIRVRLYAEGEKVYLSLERVSALQFEIESLSELEDGINESADGDSGEDDGEEVIEAKPRRL